MVFVKVIYPRFLYQSERSVIDHYVIRLSINIPINKYNIEAC